MDRKQCVVLNGACSEPSAVVSGVPQVSVLGPHLFRHHHTNLFIIGLLHADDLLLYRVIHNQWDFQLNIDQVSDWVDENHLTVNAAESIKVMVISCRRVPSTPEVRLPLLSQPFEQVQNYKYLRVLLNSSLNWPTHIRSICSKAIIIYSWTTIQNICHSF